MSEKKAKLERKSIASEIKITLYKNGQIKVMAPPKDLALEIIAEAIKIIK